MIAYPASLKAVGGAKTGIAPVHLLDVQDVNGNLYYWSDRPTNAPIVITGEIDAIADPPVSPSVGQYVAWAYAGIVTPEVGNSDAGSVTAGLTTGTLLLTKSAPLGNTQVKCTWSSFQFPSLPPNAVIDAIYPVAVMTGSGGNFGGNTFNISGQDEIDGQFNGSNLGSTIAAFNAASLEIEIASSVPVDGSFIDTIVVSFIGLAIYYHLSTGGEPGYYTSAVAGISGAPYLPWLLSVPSFAFHRSLQTDMGSFVVQNLSGDTLSRDMEKILRASALEGAFFVYRLWQPDAEAAWLEVHGQLTVDDDGVDTITFKGEQLINASQDDTPLEQYCETCQIQWGGRRCGSTQSTECEYSFQTCQVIERPMLALNDYEKNFGEATANVTSNRVINRRRKI